MSALYLAISFDWARHWSPSRLESPLGASLCATLAVLMLAALLAQRHRRQKTRAAEAPRGPGGLRARLSPRAPPHLLARLHGSPNRYLSALLAPYRVAPPVPGAKAEDANWALLTAPKLRGLAIALENLAGKAGVAPRLDNALARAGARLRSGEAMVLWLLSTLLLLAFGWVVAGPIGSALVALIAVAAPLLALQATAEHRSKLFAAQLPDVLKLTASSLRAGFSLLQGLEAVTKQLQEPSAGEFQRVITEARLGRPIEEALGAAAARIDNPDFSESVAAVRIQQEAGGNLASLFETLAETMLQRVQLRREVRTLTAEARLSAYVLAALPMLIAGFLFATSRQYVLVLFDTRAGKVALLGALALQLLGFLWMYRTVKIEG